MLYQTSQKIKRFSLDIFNSSVLRCFKCVLELYMISFLTCCISYPPLSWGYFLSLYELISFWQHRFLGEKKPNKQRNKKKPPLLWGCCSLMFLCSVSSVVQVETNPGIFLRRSIRLLTVLEHSCNKRGFVCILQRKLWHFPQPGNCLLCIYN